jgi:hypothetical protein
MEQESSKKLAELKDRLERGEYAIDPAAVADAIIRRSREAAVLRTECRELQRRENARDRPAQNECSYPSSSFGPSVNRMPAGPALTSPIHVIRTLGSRLASRLSTALRAAGGMHAHSS